MMTLKKKFAALTAVSVMALTLILPAATASACSSGQFCAYANTSYSGLLVTATTTTNNATVDVANNDTESGKNFTTAYYCGVQADWWPNSTVFRWSPGQSSSTLGGANNTIDHFYVRSGGNQCD